MTVRSCWLPVSRMVRLGLLVLSITAVPFVSALVLRTMATLTLILAAIWEQMALRRHPELAEAEPAA